MKKHEYSALKRFPILQFLAAVNCVPVYVTGREHYFVSPLRAERTASFSVNSLKNNWYDHGLGIGGNLLDLALRLFETDYKTAGQMLAQIVAGVALHEAPNGEAQARNRGSVVELPAQKMKLRSATTLRHPVLRQYLVDRGISLAAIEADGRVWSRLYEVRYTQLGKSREYFAIGMMNESGGVELSAKNFKSCLGAKDVTYIAGRQPGIAIFEGMMDFLSALTMRYKKFKGKVANFQCSVLILHSARLAKNSLHLVQNAGSIFYYGDNDQTGIDLMHWYKKTCKNCAFHAMNEQYRGYKDLNDALLKIKPSKPLPARGQAPSHRAETAKWWVWVLFEGSRRREDHECTFYAYSNLSAAYEQLLTLRNRLSEDAKVIRLCTRTTGRAFTYEQLFCPTGRVTTGTGGDAGLRTERRTETPTPQLRRLRLPEAARSLRA